MPRQKYIAVCTPSLGMVSIDWAGSLRGLAWPMNTGFASFFTLDEAGHEIAETRNACVVKALEFENAEREVSHIFWLDDDVHPSRLAVIKLLSHHVDIVSGVYFSKNDVSEPLIFPGPGEGTLPFVPDQFFEVWGHGMGLALVRLEVYRRMERELYLERDRYGRPAWYRTLHLEDGQGVASTEDLYFLGKAHTLGYRPRVDTSASAFGWHYDPVKRQGYPVKQYAQLRSGGPIIWETPDGPVLWK